jgi:hypothetical protein
MNGHTQDFAATEQVPGTLSHPESGRMDRPTTSYVASAGDLRLDNTPRPQRKEIPCRSCGYQPQDVVHPITRPRSRPRAART